jgi:hypothetical protein
MEYHSDVMAYVMAFVARILEAVNAIVPKYVGINHV